MATDVSGGDVSGRECWGTDVSGRIYVTGGAT